MSSSDCLLWTFRDAADLSPLDLLRAADADPVRAPGTGDTATPDITIEPHRSASAIDVVGAPDHGAGFFGCARAQLL